MKTQRFGDRAVEYSLLYILIIIVIVAVLFMLQPAGEFPQIARSNPIHRLDLHRGQDVTITVLGNDTQVYEGKIADAIADAVCITHEDGVMCFPGDKIAIAY